MATKTKKIVFTALMASLTCVATMIIKIPTPLQGYIHLGDCIALLCGWTLGPIYGFCAAAIGSALADLLSGYFIYAPVTFAIKGIVALLGWILFKLLHVRMKDIFALCVSAIIAELFMVGGYYLFEGILYGFGASLVNVPMNLIQALGGVVFGVVLVKAIGKYISFNDDGKN
jgi:uncharacterized membrane protein